MYNYINFMNISIVCSICKTDQDTFGCEITCKHCNNLICIKCRNHLFKVKHISKL